MLFVDLVGFTSWSEGQDPADVREVLSGYFEVGRSVVAAHGGRVEKFIGDAVMAVWGVDVAHADDPLRAVRAAMEVVTGVAAFGASRGIDLLARGGVVTGQVAAWSSEGEGLVTGDRVNTAARVQAAAEPGQVWVDEATRQAARDGVEFSDVGSFTVKGKQAALRLWRAVRAVPRGGGAVTGSLVEAPLMSRVRELHLIKGLFHAAVESTQPRVVLASGGQGVGKSRLLREFVTYLDGLVMPVAWHEGRCASYGSVAFGAWAEMVRQRFQLAEDAPKDQVAAALVDRLPSWVPDEEERQFVATRLSVLLGVSNASLDQADLFAGWRLFVERLAAVHPVVMVFEDLQWADDGLLQFLEHLVDHAGREPIFVIAAAQTELLEQHPDWLSGRRALALLSVDPLPDDAMYDLVAQLVPGFPAPVAEQVVAFAQGVPLYAVEVVRMLVDRGMIEARGGVLQLISDVTDLETPASLTGLIAARLDVLPSHEYDLLLGLAVLGATFSRAAVPAISNKPPEEIDRCLESLVRKDVLTAKEDPLLPDRGQYAFTQNLFRSVTYSLVPRRHRNVWHTKVADHLLSAFPNDGEDVIETVAAHYTDAYNTAVRADQEALRRQAMAAHERAGDRAGALGAPNTGEKHFHTAAGLASNEADSTRCIACAAEMAGQAGRFDDALALFETAAEAHTTSGRPLDAARLASRIGNCLGPLGRGDEAVERLHDALVLLRDQPDEPARAKAEAALGQILFFTGDRNAAAEHIEQAVTLATELELPVLAPALMIQAYLLSADGDINAAEAAMAAAVDVAHQAGKTHTEIGARSNLGELRFTSDLPDAERECRSALELARRMGYGYGQAHGYADLARWSFVTGAWHDVKTLAEEGVSVAPDPLTRGHVRLPLVLMYSARGRTTLAAEHFAEMRPLSTSDDTQDVAAFKIAQAALALSEGRPEEALTVAAQAAEATMTAYGLRTEGFRLAWPLALRAAVTSQQAGRAKSLLNLVEEAPPDKVPPYLKAQLAHYRALLCAGTSEHGTIEVDLDTSIGILRGLGYPYWLGETQTDLARWLIHQGRPTEARPLLTEAIATFSRLGAQPLLDAAENLLKRPTPLPP